MLGGDEKNVRIVAWEDFFDFADWHQ